MRYKIIMVLCAIVSLFVITTKAIAKPPEIEELPDIKIYAFEKVYYRWGSEQWDSFEKLVKREGNWNNKAQNPSSSAYGIGQFLDSTWSSVGCEKTSDKYIQIDCMIEYIDKNYDTPQKALTFHYRQNYY